MKRFGVIAGIIFCIIIFGVLLITTEENEKEITEEKTKVGLILNGSAEDKSWSQSHYEGLMECVEELNLEVILREEVPQDETSVLVMEELIDSGCEVIICNSYGFGEWEQQVARKYPEIYFFHATGVEGPENMDTYFGRIYQMRYLCGVVAGMQTETDKIGYVAAFPISEVNRGINAFTLGVRAVNAEATVYVKWSDSWTDDKLNEEAARILLEEYDIDVLSVHTDSCKPLEVAQEEGVWSIGYNYDNSEMYPDTYLTAAVWEWGNFYKPHILACLQDKFVGKHYWEGVETGLVSLAPFTKNVKPGILERVEEERLRLQSGTFDVFYGPIEDNEGNLRVAEKESMSDNSMLNKFDWYVKGVVVNEEN